MSFPLLAASYQVLVPCFSDIARRGTGRCAVVRGRLGCDRPGDRDRAWPDAL